MGHRTIAPRLRLLGLLLICASIIMGLLLSAIGVQSVTLNSPFAQEIAGQIQNVSNTNLNVNTTPIPAYQSGLNGLPQHSHLPIPADSALTSQHKKPFTISLWALVAPICLVGILLWMTPMPAAATGTNRSYKRH